MAKNTYAKRLDAARAAREYAIRRYTRQQMLDFVTIALGRMGYGEKRLKDFEKMLSAFTSNLPKRLPMISRMTKNACTQKSALTVSCNNTVEVALSRMKNDILRRSNNGCYRFY